MNIKPNITSEAPAVGEQQRGGPFGHHHIQTFKR
jgi:hypothetical protein